MARRITIDAARLEAAAAKAAAAEQASISEEVAGIALTCRYLGVADSTGGIAEGVRPTAKKEALFEWSADASGLPREKCSVTIRCDNAVGARPYGVPFPPPWRVALRCAGLGDIAISSARDLAARTSLEGLRCQLVGAAKPSFLPPADAAQVTGAEVLLQDTDGVRQRALLTAHVSDNVWLCLFGAADVEMALSAENLATADITAGVQVGPPLAKRSKCGPDEVDLRAAAATDPAAWNFLVATATFKAEGIRAAAAGRPFDEGMATIGFEKNAWQWSGRAADIAFLWRWRRGTEWRHELVKAKLDNVLTRGAVVAPAGCDVDGDLHDRLLQVAAVEAELRKAPVKYLGLFDGDRFEPDPSKWSSKLHGGCKTKATVTYEWEHVLCDGQPLHGSTSANNLIYLGQSVPFHPLGRAAPLNLTLTPDFLAAVAFNVKPGTTWQGVCYDEADRIEILPLLPNGGVDAQDQELYWTLPCGKCICMSVRRLAEAHEDELAASDAEEAYRAVAAQLGYDCLGAADSGEVLALRENPGTLAERCWDAVSWLTPPDEAAPCWWLSNAAEADTSLPPRLLSRSLACLRLELRHARCATTAKLRSAYECRQWPQIF
jgi:hypothetical protein